MLYFGLNQTGSYLVNYNQGYETNPIAQLMYQTVNNSLSEYFMIVDYYRSVFGVQPTLDNILRYTRQYTVTTTKVPEDYSVSDNTNLLSSNLVTSTTRMAQLEGANSCQDGSVFQHRCSQPGVTCWECTYTMDDICCGLPKSGRSCAAHGKDYDYYSDCTKAN